jgi:hypothetical protein
MQSKRKKKKRIHPSLRQEGKPSNFVLSYIFSREARKTARIWGFRLFSGGASQEHRGAEEKRRSSEKK